MVCSCHNFNYLLTIWEQDYMQVWRTINTTVLIYTLCKEISWCFSTRKISQAKILHQPCCGVEQLPPVFPMPSCPFLFAPQDHTDPLAYVKDEGKNIADLEMSTVRLYGVQWTTSNKLLFSISMNDLVNMWWGIKLSALRVSSWYNRVLLNNAQGSV